MDSLGLGCWTRADSKQTPVGDRPALLFFGPDGQSNGRICAFDGKVLGVPVRTLGNRVRLNERAQLNGTGDKPVSAELMELARLRAAGSA